MRKVLSLFAIACFLFGIPYAHAVPSFARQTGLSCNVCHTQPPELTAFGRNFKLKGYVLTDMTAKDKVGNSKDLLLSRFIPLAAMVILSDTADQVAQPGTQNNTVEFPQQLSIFLAGAYAANFGSLISASYSHQSNHFNLTNSDLRYANQGKLDGKDWWYGITLNNSPTVEDVWNSTPVWGYPYINSTSALSPLAAPIINGALAQDVAGLGGYSMWDNHLYTAVTLYRSEHAGGPVPITGKTFANNISGVAPYWRAAWQQTFGDTYLEVGTYGIVVDAFPNAISGPENRYVDPSIDFQLEHPFGANLLDAHGRYTHESSNLAASFATGAASQKSNYLNAWELDSTYHWGYKYTATGSIFSTTGNTDPLLYAPAPVTGSNNGNPDTYGYVAQFGYWPVQNIELTAEYTGYTKFNGASSNYDGAHRNASDNNSLYLGMWLNF